MAAIPSVSRSSFFTSALSIIASKNGQGPPRPAGVFDKRIFKVHLHALDARRTKRFRHRTPTRAEADECQLPSGPQPPLVNEAIQPRQLGRLTAELDQDLANFSLEMLYRTIHAEHALDHDADPVGHAFHIPQDV